jgi:Alkylmercury lyase
VDLENLRLAIYHSFADTAAAPDYSDLALRFGVTRPEVVDGLRQLAAQRHLVLDERDKILMAHPFASIPLGYSIMGTHTLWWGGCCWDSFAMPHLLTGEPDLLVATQCPGCGRPGAWVVDTESAPPSEWLAHFLVPASQIWDNVVRTCSNQRLFCSEGCINDWLTRNHHQKGYVMDVETLWNFASHWYEGRLDRGYVRREPTAAADYLRSVGLVDPFWGTA